MSNSQGWVYRALTALALRGPVQSSFPCPAMCTSVLTAGKRECSQGTNAVAPMPTPSPSPRAWQPPPPPSRLLAHTNTSPSSYSKAFRGLWELHGATSPENRMCRGHMAASSLPRESPEELPKGMQATGTGRGSCCSHSPVQSPPSTALQPCPELIAARDKELQAPVSPEDCPQVAGMSQTSKEHPGRSSKVGAAAPGPAHRHAGQEKPRG